MALYTWQPSYSVGADHLDEQHVVLVGIINILYDSLQAGNGRDITSDIVNELLAYTRFHFAHEERFYVRNQLATLQEHRKLHASFVLRLLDFRKRLDSGSVATAAEVLAAAGDWFIRHIKRVDKLAVISINKKMA